MYLYPPVAFLLREQRENKERISREDGENKQRTTDGQSVNSGIITGMSCRIS